MRMFACLSGVLPTASSIRPRNSPPPVCASRECPDSTHKQHAMPYFMLHFYSLKISALSIACIITNIESVQPKRVYYRMGGNGEWGGLLSSGASPSRDG